MAAANAEEVNDCIGNLEHHIHRVFASVRVAGEDFVYCSSQELFSRLDDYCDEATMLEMKPPVLLKGESGTGKTALLANWLHRREHALMRMRNNSDEFIFWHAVGCSRQSLNVNSLLRRLISDLKTRFELARQIPKSQERLSWELPRFLELAAKKGKVIIVIDGLHRLRSNDGGEDALAWLPLSFPPNVRVILSVTVPASGTGQSHHAGMAADIPEEVQIETFTPFAALHALANRNKEVEHPIGGAGDGAGAGSRKKSRILTELDRRCVPSLTMRALDGSTCRQLVSAYIEKSISLESSRMATAGPFIQGLLSHAQAEQQTQQPAADYVTGFLLFEQQLDTLLKHSLGGNPLFLRLFLRCLHFLCARGHSLWRVFEDWIKAVSVQDLISRILRTCEAGYSRTRQQAQRDQDLSLDAGGLAEIKRVYARHPAFKGMDGGELRTFSDVLPVAPYANPNASTTDADSMASLAGKPADKQAAAANGFGPQMEEKKDAPAALSNQVLQNLGDQQWITVERLVQRQLQRALIDSRRVVEDAVSVEGGLAKDRSHFVDSVLSKIKQTQAQQASSRTDSLDDGRGSTASAPTGANLVRARTTLIGTSSTRSNSVSSSTGLVSHKDEAAAMDMMVQEDEEDGSWASDSGQQAAAAAGSSAKQSRSSSPTRTYLEPTTPSRPSSTNGGVQHALVHGESINFLSPTDLATGAASPQMDPSDGFFSLPLYMRGGESVNGFGDLLGNALALLYVARQGLKEEELWKILSKLLTKKRLTRRLFIEKKEQVLQQEATVCKVASDILKAQGMLEDVVKAEDITRSHYVPVARMHAAMRSRCLDDLKIADFRMLLDFMLKHSFGGDPACSMQGFEGRPFLQEDSVHYNMFFNALKKLNRRFHFNKGTRPGGLLGNANAMSKDCKAEGMGLADCDEDTFDDFHLPTAAAEQEDGEGHGDGNEDDDEAMGSAGDSLGPVVEEALLQILCALGVLYSPENKVLILPSDSEPFRHTIYDRYILPRGGGSVQYWHNLIIQYFLSQGNSLRKCEELPWHLKICRKWTSLKDCLVDLKTFDLMFHNDLKDELMDYWRLLTEGPLYVVDPAIATGTGLVSRGHGGRGSFLFNGAPAPRSSGGQGAEGDGDDEGDNQSTLSHILREIDDAQAARLPVKDMKKRLLRFQMQPFDVVEELNRSIEAWITAERPSPYWIHRNITQIARFLLEFSKFTHSCPLFRRLGIEMSVLERFGLLFDELKEDIHSQPSPGPGDNAEENGGVPEGKSPNEMVKAAPAAKGAKDKYFDGLAKQDVLRFPTPKMAAGNLYLYLRWVWIQFPWLALHPAATVAVREDAALDNTMDGNEGNDEGLMRGELMADESVKHLLRVWNVKKSDPTVPVFTSSLNRKLAAIKPRTSLSSNLERNVEASCRKLYEELTAPSHIAQARLGIGITQRDKFRRTFQQEVELSKSIPFAYHGVKAMKSGSLFPSYNASVRESNRKKVEADLLSLDSADNESLHSHGHGSKKRKPMGKFNLDSALKNLSGEASGAQQPSTFFLTELDDEIRRITQEEYLQSHRTDAAANSLIKDETDLEVVSFLDRISRMKAIYNKLLIIQREKERSIDELENDIVLRQESDTHLINEVTNGEALIKSLHERNIAMEMSLREAKVLQEGYLELMKALKLNPPYNEPHVQALEVEVDLARRQFDDLCQHRQRLYSEGEKLDNVRKQQLTERINYFKVAREEIGAKKKQVQREIKHLKVAMGDKKRDAHGKHRHRRHRHSGDGGDRMHSDRSAYSSDDSDSSKESLKDMTLTKPVIHFINALVRKVTYNEPIIKDTDKSLDDVKKRAAASSELANAPAEPAAPAAQQQQQAMPAAVTSNVMTSINNLMKRKARATEVVHRSAPHPQHPQQQGHGGGGGGGRGAGAGSDSDSVSLQSQAVRQQHAAVTVASSAASSSSYLQRRRLSQDEVNQLKDSIKSLVHSSGTAANPSKPDNFKAQLQKALALMLQRTESNSFDDFLERFLQGQSLLETLRSQQVLVDSRLSQLRAEHAELYAVWSDISFLADESSTPAVVQGAGSPAPVMDTPADRYLDNQLFAKEVRLHHFQRMFDKTVHVVSEVRTAIAHIMGLLTINSKLLAALPRTPAPQLTNDSDMAACLSWCEDRIIALNEALTMDANRPNAASNEEKSKPLAQRQADLAEDINKMLHEKKSRRGGGGLYKAQRKAHGAMSKVLIISSDSNGFVSSPRAVVVPPATKVDKIYDAKMTKLVNERDRQLDLSETHSFYSRDTSAQNEVQRFLAEGLDLKQTKDMSRQAKVLLNNRMGRAQTYGLVLEELMKARGQAFHLSPATGVMTKSPGTGTGSGGKQQDNPTATSSAEQPGTAGSMSSKPATAASTASMAGAGSGTSPQAQQAMLMAAASFSQAAGGGGAVE